MAGAWGVQEEPEFEPLVDHRGWMGHVDHYVRGPAIHEMFVNLRGPGGYIGCHCGGPAGMGYDPTYSSGIIGGRWAVQYMSLIIALRDIGPGDGATVLCAPLLSPLRRALTERSFLAACRARTNRRSRTRRSR